MQEMYGVKVSAGLLSKITDKLLPIITQWQNIAPRIDLQYCSSSLAIFAEFNSIAVKKVEFH